MTAYYTVQFTGSAGQLAKAEAVTSEYQNVATGFALAQAFDVTTIHGQPGENPSALPAAATRASKWMKFDANGNPIIVASPLNPRGAWAANTVYNVGDAFTYLPNNSLYYVTTGYTSGSTFGSTDTTNTLVIVSLASLFFTTPNIVIGPATQACVAGNSYGADTTSGAIALNLPTANLGDSPINVTLLPGTTANQVTVNTAAGQYFGKASGAVTQIVCDIVPANFSLQYWGATYGWQLRTLG